MLYNKIENTYIVDEEDAIFLYGMPEYNRLIKSGDIYYVTKASLKSSSSSKPPKPISTGKKITNNTGKRITSNKMVMCVETGEVFDSIKEVNVKYGFQAANICACCKGRVKSANGYHWRYV